MLAAEMKGTRTAEEGGFASGMMRREAKEVGRLELSPKEFKFRCGRGGWCDTNSTKTRALMSGGSFVTGNR